MQPLIWMQAEETQENESRIQPSGYKPVTEGKMTDTETGTTTEFLSNCTQTRHIFQMLRVGGKATTKNLSAQEDHPSKVKAK